VAGSPTGPSPAPVPVDTARPRAAPRAPGPGPVIIPAGTRRSGTNSFHMVCAHRTPTGVPLRAPRPRCLVGIRCWPGNGTDFVYGEGEELEQVSPPPPPGFCGVTWVGIMNAAPMHMVGVLLEELKAGRAVDFVRRQDGSIDLAATEARVASARARRSMGVGVGVGADASVFVSGGGGSGSVCVAVGGSLAVAASSTGGGSVTGVSAGHTVVAGGPGTTHFAVGPVRFSMTAGDGFRVVLGGMSRSATTTATGGRSGGGGGGRGRAQQSPPPRVNPKTHKRK
jgi:hypothetical protein